MDAWYVHVHEHVPVYTCTCTCTYMYVHVHVHEGEAYGWGLRYSDIFRVHVDVCGKLPCVKCAMYNGWILIKKKPRMVYRYALSVHVFIARTV